MDTEENEDTLEENGGQMDGYFINVNSKENMHYIYEGIQKLTRSSSQCIVA